MGEATIIRAALEQVRKRRRWLRAWAGLWRGMFTGSCIWLAAVALYKVLPLPGWVLGYAGIAGVGAVLVGVFRGWRGQETLSMAARWMDREWRLRERLGTAWELIEQGKGGEWRELLLVETAARLQGLEVVKALPYGLPKWTKWVVLLLALGAGMGFVPEYRSDAYLRERAMREAQKEVGRRLSELAVRQLEHRPPVLESTRRLLDEVRELGLRLGKAELDREQAMRELASVAERLRAELDGLKGHPALRREEPGAGSPTAPEGAAEMRRRLEDMVAEMGERALDVRRMEKVASDLELARLAAANLGKGDSEASKAARERLGEALAELGRQAADLGVELPGLEEAMRALAAGELGRMLEALELAGTDLGKAMKLARALEGMKLELGRLEQGEGTVWDDREALMAAWEHLQTAQLCLGSGAGWAACRSRIPGSGPSGRPGSGVGTWADEASALNEVEPIGLWDNSGIARPEMEGRGHTDRGAGRVSDALVPTQAKGQLRAGRPMPAVTLRGLSVRGQSGVDYEEVVTAAQVEAQSALSQERVPRAYRGAVRRYFDEIRE